MFWTKLANQSPYTTSIRGIRLRLGKLQVRCRSSGNQNKKAERRSSKYVDIDRMLHYQRLPFMPKIIQTELISRHHNNPLAGDFGIDKIKAFISQKYYWLSLWKGVEAYVRGCDVYLALKAVRHKFYIDLQALPVPTHWWKNLIKMVYYKPVKITIDAPGLVKVTFDIVVWHYGLPNSIVSDKDLLFTSKFWLLFCYFLSRTVLWRPIFGLLSTSSQTIRPSFYQWLSLRITTPRIRALATCLLS